MKNFMEKQCGTNGRNGEKCERFVVPRTDILEKSDGLVLVADLPGVDEKSVDIGIEKNSLTITGKLADSAPDGLTLSRRELPSASYRRVFQLSELIDTARIEASMKDGVLRLFLPKSERVKPRKIEVQAA